MLRDGGHGEFAVAKKFLEGLGGPDRVSFVPGNHDAYVRTSMRDVERYLSPWMTTDSGRYEGFPYVRMIGPVALVGLSSAVPTGPFVASDDATSVQWSESHGGSLELTFAPGWKPRVARLDLSADPALWAEYQQALSTGGTIRYNIIVRHDDIVGSAPGWFESIWIGNTNGCWDQQFGGSDGQIGLYGAGAFPAGGVTTIEVSYPIEAGAAVRDRRAQFSTGSGWNEIFLGMNSGGGGYSGARYFIDNFSVVADAAPPPPVIPDLSIEPARPGLHLIASGNSRWDRQTVRTTIPEHSWVGRGSPVTYRFGLSSFPRLPEFVALLYLVPGTHLPATNTPPDQHPKFITPPTPHHSTTYPFLMIRRPPRSTL